MRWTTLDRIIRGYLLKKRYPIHFYAEFLVYAASILRELHFDTLHNVRTKKIEVDENGIAKYPCDYMDWTKVGIANGQFVRRLTQRFGMNNLKNFDTTGDVVPYPNEGNESFIESAIFNWSNTVRYNDKGELTGRYFGGAGPSILTFKAMNDRGEFQTDQSLCLPGLILEYISDGTDCDNATQVNPYAIQTIEDGMGWQHKEHNRSYGEGERARAKSIFEISHRRLRGRMNPLTTDDIKYIINRRANGAPN